MNIQQYLLSKNFGNIFKDCKKITVLDLGSGYSDYTLLFLAGNSFVEITCVDKKPINPKEHYQLAKKLLYENNDNKSLINNVLGKIEQSYKLVPNTDLTTFLGANSGFYNVIIAHHSLHFLDYSKFKEAISKIMNSLKDNGVFICRLIWNGEDTIPRPKILKTYFEKMNYKIREFEVSSSNREFVFYVLSN